MFREPFDSRHMGTNCQPSMAYFFLNCQQYYYCLVVILVIGCYWKLRNFGVVGFISYR